MERAEDRKIQRINEKTTNYATFPPSSFIKENLKNYSQ